MIDSDLLGKIKEEKTGGKKSVLSKKNRDGLFFLFVIILPFTGCILFLEGLDVPSSSPPAHNTAQSEREMSPFERRTNAGLPIEKGANIDYRIDSDKIINLSVNMIRRKGYRCNSLSSIKLYKHPERIVVECNEGKDRYRIQKDSVGRMRQVTRM